MGASVIFIGKIKPYALIMNLLPVDAKIIVGVEFTVVLDII
jgi:hypothetical protein